MRVCIKIESSHTSKYFNGYIYSYSCSIVDPSYQPQEKQYHNPSSFNQKVTTEERVVDCSDIDPKFNEPFIKSFNGNIKLPYWESTIPDSKALLSIASSATASLFNLKNAESLKNICLKFFVKNQNMFSIFPQRLAHPLDEDLKRKGYFFPKK